MGGGWEVGGGERRRKGRGRGSLPPRWTFLIRKISMSSETTHAPTVARDTIVSGRKLNMCNGRPGMACSLEPLR
jgi:hypothetical protein